MPSRELLVCVGCKGFLTGTYGCTHAPIQPCPYPTCTPCSTFNPMAHAGNVSVHGGKICVFGKHTAAVCTWHAVQNFSGLDLSAHAPMHTCTHAYMHPDMHPDMHPCTSCAHALLRTNAPSPCNPCAHAPTGLSLRQGESVCAPTCSNLNTSTGVSHTIFRNTYILGVLPQMYELKHKAVAVAPGEVEIHEQDCVVQCFLLNPLSSTQTPIVSIVLPEDL